MSDAALARSTPNVRVTAEAAVAAGEVRQLASGLAGVEVDPATSFAAGERVDYRTDGQWVMPTGNTYALLDGGRIVARGTPAELKRLVPGGSVRLEFGTEAQLELAAGVHDPADIDPAVLAVLVELGLASPKATTKKETP